MRAPRRSLALVTPPAVEPVTLAEVKLLARIDTDDEDSLLDSFITAARQAAENFTRRSYITQTWRMSLDLACEPWADNLPEGVYDLPQAAIYGDLPNVIRLPKQPIQSVTSIVSFDTDNTQSTYDPSNYTLDAAGARIYLNQGSLWPSNMRPADAMRVTYVAGYGSAATDVPQPIRTAIAMHVAQLYETRGMCGCDTPPGCQQLLQQYRIVDGL